MNKKVCIINVTTYIILWNFMSRHVVCHDYRSIPSIHVYVRTMYYIYLNWSTDKQINIMPNVPKNSYHQQVHLLKNTGVKVAQRLEKHYSTSGYFQLQLKPIQQSAHNQI